METDSLPTSSDSKISEESVVNDSDGEKSDSSRTVEVPQSDSQEILIENEEQSNELMSAVKERRINRRIALAMANSQTRAPVLRPIGKVLKTDNNTIDLTTEDDDPTNIWIKQFSPEFKKPTIARKTFAVPVEVAKNVPKSLRIGAIMKKQLEASMAVKRRLGLEKRRKMYEMDNEHLKVLSDEEEETRKIKKKTIKKKAKTSDIFGDDYDSADDEDYKEEESPENSDDSDADEKPKKSNGTQDIFDENTTDRVLADDEMSVNLLNDSFTYDIFNNGRNLSGPGSTISTADFNARETEMDNVIRLPTVKAMEDALAMEDSQMDDLGDILSLCSGRFTTGQLVSSTPKMPDTMQMLLDEKVEKDEEKPTEEIDLDAKESVETNAESDESDDEEIFKVKKKPVRTVDSDDDEEKEVNDSIDSLPQTVPLAESSNIDEVEEVEEKEKPVEHRRVVISDDESEDDDADDEAEDEEEAEGEVENEEEEEEVEEEEAEPVEEEPEPNFDDEDDELAVYKRMEHQEYKQKVKKATLFDDEASLSGDDVGSDADEDNKENVYEAEEGDADDVPDMETIRRQNNKLLLKQENDKEHRALAKLQEQLLADGDLGGVETNRNFRFKLREDAENLLENGVEEDNDKDNEEEEVEDDEETKKEKARLLKFRIENAEELMQLEDPKHVDDPFEKAGRLVKTTNEQKVAAMEMASVAKPKNHHFCQKLHLHQCAAAAGATKVDKSFVDENAEKLTTHVCINAYIQGEEPGPKIRADSKYPKWLFEMNLEPPKAFEDLDAESDGWAYWRALRKRQIEQNQRIKNLERKFLHLQNSPSMEKK